MLTWSGRASISKGRGSEPRRPSLVAERLRSFNYFRRPVDGGWQGDGKCLEGHSAP